MNEYVKKMRFKVGKEKFIHPAARIIVENQFGQILVIERMDNGMMGIPAGALEEGETIEECIKREVLEETGLKILDMEVISISSCPDRETVTYSNGDVIQYFTIEFYSNRWEGQPGVQDGNEVKSAKFVDRSMIGQLPENELSAFESLNYFRKYHKIMLK